MVRISITLTGAVRSSKKAIACCLLVLACFVSGCTSDTKEEPVEETPAYSGCIVLSKLEDNYYHLGYEIHYKELSWNYMKDPQTIFDPAGVVYAPEDIMNYYAQYYAEHTPEPVCPWEDYPDNWHNAQTVIQLEDKDLPDLVERLENLQIHIVFERKETGGMYEDDTTLPVIVTEDQW